MEPRPAAAGEAMVTLVPLTVATPVKSSMRSSWPAAKLVLRGRAKELMTFELPPGLVRFTLNVVPERVTAFARLKSMPNPVLALMVCEAVMTGVPVVLKEATQTSLAGHCGVRLVIAAPVPL